MENTRNDNIRFGMKTYHLKISSKAANRKLPQVTGRRCILGDTGGVCKRTGLTQTLGAPVKVLEEGAW